MTKEEKNLLLYGLKEIFPQRENFPIKQMEVFFDEILFWNPRYHLVNASGSELISRHFLDCCLLFPQIPEEKISKGADIGSGAGFPGILLALFFPNIQWSLIERSGRRVSFLENVQVMLGLSNVNIIPQSVEEIKDQYDFVTFRAFRSLAEPDLMSVLFKILQPDGLIAAYKGKREKIDEELLGVKQTHPETFTTVKPISCSLLKNEERHVVYLSKDKASLNFLV